MSRKQFIESVGASCKNWYWSWSFINSKENFIIFGEWDRNNDGQKTLIFSDEWNFNDKGEKQRGYQQSRDHIRMIEEEGFRLMTFPMKYSGELKDKSGNGPSKIDGFTPILSERILTKIGTGWYASDKSQSVSLTEEISSPEKYAEGAKITVTINAYERSAAARKACIQHHGSKCAACDFDFERTFGEIAKGFIHVHHIVPIGSVGKEYRIDPITDLIPVCPNCHAMIHLVNPMLSISQIQTLLSKNKT